MKYKPHPSLQRVWCLLWRREENQRNHAGNIGDRTNPQTGYHLVGVDVGHVSDGFVVVGGLDAGLVGPVVVGDWGRVVDERPSPTPKTSPWSRCTGRRHPAAVSAPTPPTPYCFRTHGSSKVVYDQQGSPHLRDGSTRLSRRCVPIGEPISEGHVSNKTRKRPVSNKTRKRRILCKRVCLLGLFFNENLEKQT